MAVTLEQRPTISPGDIEMVAIDFTPWLDSAESLTGTPIVAEQTTAHLTIANIAVSTGALTILGTSVAAGKAVQFKVTGQQAGTKYRIRVTTSTNATPARTAVRDIIIRCE